MPKVRMQHHSHQQAREKGKYAKNCGSLLHDDGNGFQFLLEVARGSKAHMKRLKPETKQCLIDRGFIKKWTKYICNECVEKGKRTSMCIQQKKTTDSHVQEEEEASSPSSSDESSNLENVCEMIERDLGSALTENGKLYERRNHDIDELVTYDPQKWLSEQPSELLTSVKQLCSLDEEQLDEKKSYLLAKVIEHIYHLRNNHVVLPLSLRENILLYSYTNSKQATDFMSSVGPSGSYTTILRCLDTSADDPIEVPNGVCRVAFDNNQVMGETCTGIGDNKVPSTIMCSTAYIQMEESDIQHDKKMKPEHWMWEEFTPEQRQNVLVSTYKYEDFFRKSRNMHIEQNITELKDELSSTAKDPIEEYAEKLANVANEKVCIECGGANDKAYRVCRNCQGPLTIPPDVDCPDFENDAKLCDPYSAFRTTEIQENSAKVTAGEPYFLNPNSPATIVEVLRNIGRQAGIVQYGGGQRQWLFVECDGVPYKIMRDIIDNVWLCSSCQQSYYRQEEFKKHTCYILGKCTSGVREFSWIIPVVGLFHLELNVAKSFLAVNWEVFVSTLADTLGFRSEKAQQYLKKGSDHHKTWKLLEIMYLALSKELVHPYVTECRTNRREATVEGYWDWCDNEVKDPNYMYMQQMTFTYLHALMMLRTGARRNNVEAISAAKTKLFHLVYSGNHKKYQEILYRDMRDQVLMPKVVLETLERSFTVSRTGLAGHYQGGDACLEEINKEAKSWLKLGGGVPDNKRRTSIFRNLQKLEKISEETVHATQSCEPGPSEEPDLQRKRRRDVARTRATLRRSAYLTTPTKPNTQKSMDGLTNLNPDLVNFSVISKDMARDYVSDALEGSCSRRKRIHVTDTDVKKSQRVEQMTISEIQESIRSELKNLPARLALDMVDGYNKAVKSGLKSTYLDFYYQVLEEVQLLNEEELSEGDDDIAD